MKISLNWLTDYVDIPMSARELGELFTGIGLNCDGIDDSGDDVVFDLDVTSNRPDWLGHLGVARELAAAAGLAFKPPHPPVLPTSGNAGDITAVDVQAPQLCPRYTARVIRNVKVAPSPAWLVERLASVGLRSVNNIVDITNFVLFEYSQPLHSFDYDKLDENRIVVRPARDGELLVAIDGTKCALTPEMLVIADAAKPVAIAGVMGGLNTEVTGETKNILLESAQFDPLSIRRTSRKLQMMSDSNYRFERGVDVLGVEAASMRACQLILEIAGGQLAGGSVDVWAKPVAPAEVTLRPERTNKILGLTIEPARQAEHLSRLGLAPRMESGLIVCTVPSFRGDLTREIDLIEEVARLEGYDKIPVGGLVKHALHGESVTQRTRRQVVELMTACGFDEALTPTFVDAGENELFGFNEPITVDVRVRKTNNFLRGTLLSSLLRCCKVNQDAGNTQVNLFELAKVFPRGQRSDAAVLNLPEEFTELAMVSRGELRELRGTIETVAARLAPKARLEVQEQPLDGLAAGTSALMYLDGELIGAIGMIDTRAQSHYGLEHPVAAGRLRFESLLARAGAVRTYAPLPKFPSVTRDLSLIVPETATWRQIEQAATSVAQPMRVGMDYVTTYRGKQIPDGQKSLTLTLTYRWNEGTLRSEQVDEQVQQVVDALKRDLGAEIRK